MAFRICAALLAVLFFVSEACAQTVKTKDFIAVHKVLSAPGGVYRFDDGRTIRGKIYNVGGCQTFAQLRTGTAFPNAAGNYTAISYNAPFLGPSCVVKGTGAANVYDSAQVIVIEANGWEMTPNQIYLDDIDSQIGVPAARAWRESAAVFGLRGNQVVLPTVGLPGATLLKVEPYTFPASSFAQIGMSGRPDVRILGARYAPQAPNNPNMLFNCPDDPRTANAQRCRSDNLFTSPVDTLIFVYGAANKSPNDPNAVSFMSEIHLPGGCQCSEKPRVNALVPIPGSSGFCYKRKSSGKSYLCDFVGRFWCETVEVVGYTQDGMGPCGESGCPCRPFTAKNTYMLRPYTPTF